MPKENTAQTSWKYGEISPLLRGRIDTDAWKNGAETLENFITTPQGGILRRPGTEHLHYIDFEGCRLLEFLAADSSSYVFITFTGTYSTDRWGSLVLKDGAKRYGPVGQRIENVVAQTAGIHTGKPVLTITNHQLASGDAIHVQGCNGGAADGRYIGTVIDDNTIQLTTGATSAYTGGGYMWMDKFNNRMSTISNATIGGGYITITTTTSHFFNANDTVGIDGINGATEANGQWTVFDTPTATTFRVAYAGSLTTYTGGGCVTNSVLLIPMGPVHTLGNDGLKKIQTEQSADVVFFAHPEFGPKTLSRLGEYKWEWRDLDQSDGPYLPRNTTDIFLTVSSVSDTATMTDTGAGIFVAGDVGKYVQYREDNQWKIALVTAYTSASTVTVDILSNQLLKLDSRVKLTPKNGNSTEQVARTAQEEKLAIGPGTGGNLRNSPLKKDYYAKRASRLVNTSGIDPAALLAFGGANITSTHAGTFTQYDIGKLIQVSSGAWYSITGYNSDKSVAATALTRIAGASPTNERNLVYSGRRITGTLTSSYALFSSTDVGRHVRLHFTGVTSWCKITAFSSATSVSVQFFQDVPRDPTNATFITDDGRANDWQLGAWSETTGFPATVAIHEQRLTFGGNSEAPQTIWMSVSGDYWNFSPTEPDGTVLDDNAVTYTIASESVNPIVWMVSAKVFLVGTISGEWMARAATSVTEPITPTNISVTPQSTYGSQANHKAKRVGNSIYFLQYGGERLRKMSYVYENDGWASSDVSVASEHMMRQGRAGVQLAYQINPFSILWVLLDDGTLASVTINEDENQYSWAHHTLGQSSGGCVTDSILVINNDSGTRSRLYMASVRDDASRYEIERMGGFWIPTTTTARSALDVAFTDAYVSRTLAAASTAAPNSFVPDGATVQAVINGTTYVTGVVASGVLNLGASYTGTCRIGYGYTTRLKMLPPEGGSAFGTAMVKAKRVNRVGVRFFSSYKIKHGPDTSNLISYTLTGAATNFLTGDDKFNLNSPYGLESGYVIQIDEPWPLGILAVAPELKTNE